MFLLAEAEHVRLAVEFHLVRFLRHSPSRVAAPFDERKAVVLLLELRIALDAHVRGLLVRLDDDVHTIGGVDIDDRQFR